MLKRIVAFVFFVPCRAVHRAASVVFFNDVIYQKSNAIHLFQKPDASTPSTELYGFVHVHSAHIIAKPERRHQNGDGDKNERQQM